MATEKEQSQVTTADVIFLGGDIITVSDANPTAEALAIKDGKILSVGQCEDVLKWQGNETQIIDLQGKTLMPGLIEPHTHLELSAGIYDWIDISQINNPDYSYESILQTLRDAAATKTPGEWITAFGYDPIINRELRALTADILDTVSSVHPIIVMIQSMHTTFVNHKALEVLGITDAIAQPPDGCFEKDEKGKLTGILRESASQRVVSYLPLKTQRENTEVVYKQIERFVQAGYTTIWDAGLIPAIPKADSIIRELVQAKDSPLRIIASNSEADMIKHRFPGRLAEERGGNNRFRTTGVKFWYDGSPYTGNIFLQEPYVDSELMQKGLGLPANNCGQRLYAKEKFEQLVQKYHDDGWQIAVHTQGDRAIKEVVDTFEKVLAKSPRKDHRHRLEHCILFSEGDLMRAAKLGLTVSFHINHIYYYGEALRDEILGPERANRAMPMRNAIKAGILTSLHSDSPMYPPQPFKLMRTAVSRQTRKGEVIGPEQGVNIDEAIKAVTVNAAWQLFMEDAIGSLEVGKYADLVILSDNPWKIDPDKLDEIKVIETYSEGRRVGQRPII